MSRLYFHTPTQEAGLSGAEYGWLRHVAHGHAAAAWNLDSFDRAEQFLSLVDEVPDGSYGSNYLHTYLREARAEPGLTQRLLRALDTALNVQSLTLTVHGVALSSGDLGYNAALVSGSDPIALAAKLHGWGSIHAWIEGRDRAWCADLVEDALRTGLYRRDMGWERPFNRDEGPGVVSLLRSRDDEPVVLSYSVTDGFPNARIGGLLPPDFPDYLDLSDEQWEQVETADGHWGELPADRQWEEAMRGLRTHRAWARIGPDTLRAQMFSWPVTAYDLFREDRADHLRAVLTDPELHALMSTGPAGGEPPTEVEAPAATSD